tara:strand:- start:16 stop:492 length:477 start_codon:yes stop_codon:yes gene_type:complete
MGQSVFPAPAAASKTMFRTTLTSGTSYTVPAGVTYLNVTLVGGGGGGGGNSFDSHANFGQGGQVVSSTLSATAGNSIAYAIGAGGASPSGVGATGGTTTFTGATSATGGTGGRKVANASATGGAGTSTMAASNGGGGSDAYGIGGTGGAGCIYVEYWA